jgi:hypothetical protein
MLVRGKWKAMSVTLRLRLLGRQSHYFYANDPLKGGPLSFPHSLRLAGFRLPDISRLRAFQTHPVHRMEVGEEPLKPGSCRGNWHVVNVLPAR